LGRRKSNYERDPSISRESRSGEEGEAQLTEEEGETQREDSLLNPTI